MIITIAGMPGAGKSSLKKRLAEKYFYKSYSVGDMKGEFAKSRGMNIDEFMANCSPEEVHHKADNYQKQLGETEDNFVIDGWLSWYFIPNSIKIFLETDWNTAAQRIFLDKRDIDEPKYSNIKECEETIKKRYNETRKQTMKEYQGADFDDRKNYDIIINTSDKTLEEVLKIAEQKIFEKTKNDS